MNEIKNIKKELTGYPSIDKPWLKYYDEKALHVTFPKATVYECIYTNNCSYGNEIAMIYYGKKITYKKMFSEIENVTGAFSSLGVRRGDNVAICMPAIPEALYTVLALNKIGANANMLNPTFSEVQLAERINETEAKILIVLNELYEKIGKAVFKTGIGTVVACPAANSLGKMVRVWKHVKKIQGTIEWNDFVRRGKGIAYATAKYQANTPAVTVYSSGTTGAEKGIQLTNDGIVALMRQYEYAGFDMKRQDRYIAQIPIWFSTGICVTMLVPLYLGITLILEPIFDFKLIAKDIEKYKPNFLISPMGLFEYMKNNYPRSDAYRAFKYVAVGGEYVAPRVEQEYNKWLKENDCKEGLHKGYGMCECGGTVTSSNSVCNIVGASGIPMPRVVVAAFDVCTDKELTYGKRGEIRVLTPCRMLGYYKKPEETEKYLKTDQCGNVWACTGDMGYVAEDGNVYVAGRISDSYVNDDGETIYLFDIERAVLDVPKIRQCKAIPGCIDGRKIHICHMVLTDDADVDETLHAVEKYCANKLPVSHWPVVVRLYRDSLPVAPSGKLDIKVMKENVDGYKWLSIHR